MVFVKGLLIGIHFFPSIFILAAGLSFTTAVQPRSPGRRLQACRLSCPARTSRWGSVSVGLKVKDVAGGSRALRRAPGGQHHVTRSGLQVTRGLGKNPAGPFCAGFAAHPETSPHPPWGFVPITPHTRTGDSGSAGGRKGKDGHFFLCERP